MIFISKKLVDELGTDYARRLAAKREFEADRYGHNHSSAYNPHWSRITYMANAAGYVMARRPGCKPFVLTEKQWMAFPAWVGQRER